MDKTIVISQPMYFPWCGLLNQVQLADVFVYYDDVQFARGFFNRVQVRTDSGFKWLTVPLKNFHRGQNISDCLIDYSQNWSDVHRRTLVHSYSKAPFLDQMINIFDSVVFAKPATLAELSIHSILALVEAFSLDKPIFVNSSDLGVGGSASQRLLDITKLLGGSCYLTGHGALSYLDHSIFEAEHIDVSYMQYRFLPWLGSSNSFTPYVSSLECFAFLGPDSRSSLNSNALPWRKALIDPSVLRA